MYARAKLERAELANRTNKQPPSSLPSPPRFGEREGGDGRFDTDGRLPLTSTHLYRILFFSSLFAQSRPSRASVTSGSSKQQQTHTERGIKNI